MLIRKKTPSPDQAAVLTGAARDFEVSVIELARKSERKAWWVAAGASVLALALAGSYALVMPLKQQVPYLVLADPYRGTSTVARLDVTDSTLTGNEAINKSNVAHFVIARESYDWDLLNRRDRRVVHAMATGSALKEYQALYAANNPDSPDTQYGRNYSVRVKILSTILHWADAKKDEAAPRAPTAATVRFERWLFDTATGRSRLLDTRIASLKVSYDPHLQMNEDGRIENPLGFRVHSYRVDPDAIGAATSASPPQAGAAPAALPAHTQPASNGMTDATGAPLPSLPPPPAPTPSPVPAATPAATATVPASLPATGASHAQ